MAFRLTCHWQEYSYFSTSILELESDHGQTWPVGSCDASATCEPNSVKVSSSLSLSLLLLLNYCGYFDCFQTTFRIRLNAGCWAFASEILIQNELQIRNFASLPVELVRKVKQLQILNILDEIADDEKWIELLKRPELLRVTIDCALREDQLRSWYLNVAEPPWAPCRSGHLRGAIGYYEWSFW